MPLYAFHNDHFRPLSEVSVALDDAGFVWGATVVDRCRTYGQLPFRLEDHLERFAASCKLAHVALRSTPLELREIAAELLLRNQSSIAGEVDAFLVFLATPGTLDQHSPTLVVYPELLNPAHYAPTVLKGAHLVTPKVRQPAQDSVPPRIKQRSRLHWWLAEHEAKQRAGDANALLLDAEGCLTETAVANLVLVLNEVVCSPRRARILPGISLKVLEELCASAKLCYEERDLKNADVAVASEAILTSTAYGLAPVRRIDERAFPTPGPVFTRLCAAWKKQLGFEPHAEFQRVEGEKQNPATGAG